MEIRDSVTPIGGGAFAHCYSLTYVGFTGRSSPSCGSDVFSSTAVSVVHVTVDYSGHSVCSTGIVHDYVVPSDVFSSVYPLCTAGKRFLEVNYHILCSTRSEIHSAIAAILCILVSIRSKRGVICVMIFTRDISGINASCSKLSSKTATQKCDSHTFGFGAQLIWHQTSHMFVNDRLNMRIYSA